jgi:chorismate synthase
MPGNTLGHLFRVTTFGESHGEGVGAVIDGCPPGIVFDTEFIQQQLDRRKPGQNGFSSPRKESDTLRVLSGIFEGKTTGAPIAFFIRNEDHRSRDYDMLKEVYRPGHADYTYDQKYGIRDHRGGGRSSARTTAPWVAAGALACLLLKEVGVDIYAYVSSIGMETLKTPVNEINTDAIRKSEILCPDPELSLRMMQLIQKVKEEGDSLGGVITGLIRGVPAGWGEPQFSKLSADLGHAMLSINAVKGFELGEGFLSSTKKGSESNDTLVGKDGKIERKTNRSGGIEGGISSGAPIWFRVAFKPVSSISKPQQTVNKKGEKVLLNIQGRHDPCVVPRAVPIVEAMAALVLADHYLRSKTFL